MNVHFFTVYSDISKTKVLKDTAAIFHISLTHILVSKWHGFENKIYGMMDALPHYKDYPTIISYVLWMLTMFFFLKLWRLSAPNLKNMTVEYCLVLKTFVFLRKIIRVIKKKDYWLTAHRIHSWIQAGLSGTNAMYGRCCVGNLDYVSMKYVNMEVIKIISPNTF